MRPDCTPLKTCTKCGVEKPRTAEFFNPRKDSRDGLHGTCRVCHRTYTDSWWDRNRERGNALAKAWAERNAEHVKEMRDLYHEANRERRNAQIAEWARKNPERMRRLHRDWYRRNKGRCRKNAAAWSAAHPEERESYKRNRRARERGNGGSHTGADVRAQYGRQHGRCYWCGEKVGRSYHVDHVVPVARGGSNGPENLVISCAHCNQSKNASLPHEWSDRLC